MNKKVNINYILSIITLIAIVFIGIKIYSNVPSIGSVTVGNEYKSVNSTSLTGSSTNATLITFGTRVLGSVIFATTSAQAFTIYDVAVAANYASTTLSTKIVSFATSTPAGTYTFDTQLTKGLVFFGQITPTTDYVITYR